MSTRHDELQRSVPGQRGDGRVQVVRGVHERAVRVGLDLQRGAQLGGPFLVHAVDEEVDQRELDADAHLGEVAAPGFRGAAR